MALVRSILWVMYIFLLALSIAVLVMHSITDGNDDRIDKTTTWFGIVAGIVGLVVSLMGIALLVTKNLHRRPATTFQQWANAFTVWIFSVVTGMWILYEHVARRNLKRYEDAAFALSITASLFWTVVVALWHWKAQEEYAVAHK